MIAVDTIVRQMLLFEGREPNGPYYPLYLEFALMGIRELQADFEVVAEKTYQVTPIDQTFRTAALPSDYVMWKSCGYLMGNTYVRMYHNSQLKDFFLNDDCGNPIAPTNYDNYDYWFWYGVNGLQNTYGMPSFDAYWSGRLYGLGGGSSNGGFNIENGKILFDPYADIDGTWPIILVYAPTGISPDGNSMIHDYAAEALRSFMRFQRALNANTRKQGEIMLLEDLFKKAKMQAKLRIYSLPIAEVADRIRQGTQSAPTF